MANFRVCVPVPCGGWQGFSWAGWGRPGREKGKEGGRLSRAGKEAWVALATVQAGGGNREVACASWGHREIHVVPLGINCSLILMIPLMATLV